MIPYVVWVMIYFLVFGSIAMVLPTFSNCPSLSTIGVRSVVFNVLGLGPYGVPCLFPFWYIKILILLVIASPLFFVFRHVRQLYLWCLIVLAILCEMVVCDFAGVNDYLRKFIFCPMGCVCFMLGAVFAFSSFSFKGNVMTDALRC